MGINRDQVVAMFGRFHPSALASFVAAAENSNDIAGHAIYDDWLELINIARQAGHANVGAVNFEPMVKEPIKRHGLTGHELSVLFTADRIAHAADLQAQVGAGKMDYIVTLHDPMTTDDQLTRVSIHKIEAMSDGEAWTRAHRLAEHFMCRLHSVSRVVDPITVRGAEVVGNAADLGNLEPFGELDDHGLKARE